MPDLSPIQYSVVSNLLSFAVATLGAAAIFFFIAPGITRNYRFAMTVSGLVCAIAAYHYFRISDSFAGAYVLTPTGAESTRYSPTGEPFNDFYRYADWLITVPLLMVELVAVLALPKSESRGLLIKLTVAAAAMILLGYPGEVSNSPAIEWTFWFLSMIPFVYILFVLFTQLGDAIDRQPKQVQGTIKFARMVVLVTWLFYPIAYLFNVLFDGGATGQVGVQVGYSIADITAKAGFGVVLYMAAKTKSDLELEAAGIQPAAPSTPANPTPATA